MATALTISASNPLANPLRGSYGGRRRSASSKQLDGASVYHKQHSLKGSFSLPQSPILVVVPNPPSSNLPPLSLTSSTSTAPTPSTSTPSSSSTTSPLKLSYADIVRSSPALKSSSPMSPAMKASPLGTSSTIQAPPAAKPTSRMDKKMDFEGERAKLKARRLAKKGYEKQTGKRWDSDMSHQEWEIYQAQVKLHETALAEEKVNHEEANVLAANIKHKEIVLQQLQTDLANKIKQIEDGKEELERFRLDLEESIKQQVPTSSSEKSSAVRMKEEQQKKKLRAAWRNNENPEDPIHKTRRDILIAQEDVAAFNLRIVNLKKELKAMRDIAAREASSKLIMRAEKKQREDMKKAGIEKPKAEPKPKPPPKVVEPRSHHTRMAEQKALKEKARAERRAATAAAPSS